MTMQSEVTELEKNMMELVIAAFNAAQYKQLSKLKAYCVAMDETDEEYFKITGVCYIKDATMDRLTDVIDVLTKEKNDNPNSKII